MAGFVIAAIAAIAAVAPFAVPAFAAIPAFAVVAAVVAVSVSLATGCGRSQTAPSAPTTPSSQSTPIVPSQSNASFSANGSPNGGTRDDSNAPPNPSNSPLPNRQPMLAADTWDRVLSTARGQTVRMAMWDGDAGINAYMRDEVAPAMQRDYGVTLAVVGLAGSQIANKLIVDLEAGRANGDIDVCWINGENFHQLRRADALAGPFTERLPNHLLIDWTNRFIAFDFQQPVAGYECPWGCVQFALIHHAQRVPRPPGTLAELEAWIVAHPGRFTFDNSFTGMTFLKCLLIDMAGGGGALAGPFARAKYESAAAKLWAFLRRLRPHLWRGGEVFPESVAQLHQLFANGEVDFTMSNNDGEVDSKVAQGVLPAESRAFTLRSGTIRNTHYLGIPRNSPRPEAALVLINQLI